MPLVCVLVFRVLWKRGLNLVTWFKVDDGLHKHRKRVRVGVNLEGFAAMGLWSVAGSWSADELTDGWIPDDVVDYLAPAVGQELAKRLESAGLWHRVTRDGDAGWQFHDWTDQNPTKEQVLAERAAAATRQKRARDRAREKRENTEQVGQEDPPSRRDSRVTNGDSHASVTPAVTVPPTRPDPTRTSYGSSVSPTATANGAAPDQPTFEGMPQPLVPDRPLKANDVVAVVLDAAKNAGLPKPTTGNINRISRDAKRLIEKDQVAPDVLLEAAQLVGTNGWQSLDVQVGRIVADRAAEAKTTEELAEARADLAAQRWPGNRPRSPTGRSAIDQKPSTAERRMQQALDVAAQLDAQYGTGGNP